MRKIIEAVQSKEVYDLETCVKKNLEKMFHRIPEFTVSDLSNRYSISIEMNDSDSKTFKSAQAIKRWVKEWGITFSDIKCGKIKNPRSSFTEFWCEVYK